MSRRMIDEGALDAQIQNATTTKQDKLKAGTGITIGDAWEPNKIESYVPWFHGTTNITLTVPAKAYKAGDVISAFGTQRINGLLVGTGGGNYPILPVGDTGLKVYQKLYVDTLNLNTIGVLLIAVNDATVSTPTSFKVQQEYIAIANPKKLS